MSHAAILPGLIASASGAYAAFILVMVRGKPGAQRLMFALLGLGLIGLGLRMPSLFVIHLAPSIWVGLTCVGALLLFGAGADLLSPAKRTEDSLILKPATGRPLRHFGEAP